jgi:hypothetical protein
LKGQGKRLPILGDDPEHANRNYIKHFVLDKDSEFLRGIQSDRTLGEKYGLEYAEGFHFIGPRESIMEKYIEEFGE